MAARLLSKKLPRDFSVRIPRGRFPRENKPRARVPVYRFIRIAIKPGLPRANMRKVNKRESYGRLLRGLPRGAALSLRLTEQETRRVYFGARPPATVYLLPCSSFPSSCRERKKRRARTQNREVPIDAIIGFISPLEDLYKAHQKIDRTPITSRSKETARTRQLSLPKASPLLQQHS